MAEAEELRQKLNVLQGQHNNLKGHYHEREVLLNLFQRIIDGKGGLVEGMDVTEFAPVMNYHLPSGEEIDVVVEGKHAVIMAECKNYHPRHLNKITEKTVDGFADKATRLHGDRFADRELRRTNCRATFTSPRGTIPQLVNAPVANPIEFIKKLDYET